MEQILVGVASTVLAEGVKFFYQQAGEILSYWRARRRNAAAAGPRLLAPPAGLTVGEPKRLALAPDDQTLDTLQEFKDTAERIKDGAVDINDPAARQAIDDLRALVEAALQAPIRFDGEPARPSNISDVKVVTKDVAGRVTAVRAKLADIRGVTVVTGDVREGGEVTGVDLA